MREEYLRIFKEVVNNFGSAVVLVHTGEQDENPT